MAVAFLDAKGYVGSGSTAVVTKPTGVVADSQMLAVVVFPVILPLWAP
jgi:hypothetical protein